MKRTISSMLGLLPSDQFHVMIEAFWEPLSKLVVSSIMTGSTESSCSGHTEEPPSLNMNVQGLGELSPEVLEYISDLGDHLASARQELHEVKRKNAAIQMQQFVGEDKNDLLDYLRSLKPKKVAELSEPTSSDLQDIVNCVVHGLQAILSPRMHSKSSMQSDNLLRGDLNIDKEECTEIVESTSLNFHPLISVTRDYLARLLFWCMLLGHYLRDLECRLDLAQIFALPDGEEFNSEGIKPVASLFVSRKTQVSLVKEGSMSCMIHSRFGSPPSSHQLFTWNDWNVYLFS